MSVNRREFIKRTSLNLLTLAGIGLLSFVPKAKASVGKFNALSTIDSARHTSLLAAEQQIVPSTLISDAEWDEWIASADRREHIKSALCLVVADGRFMHMSTFEGPIESGHNVANLLSTQYRVYSTLPYNCYFKISLSQANGLYTSCARPPQFARSLIMGSINRDALRNSVRSDLLRVIRHAKPCELYTNFLIASNAIRNHNCSTNHSMATMSSGQYDGTTSFGFVCKHCGQSWVVELGYGDVLWDGLTDYQRRIITAAISTEAGHQALAEAMSKGSLA